MLMDDFRFMEAARIQSGEYEGAMIDIQDLKDTTSFHKHLIINRDGLVLFPFYNKPEDPAEAKDETTNTLSDRRLARFTTQVARWPPLDIWAHWVLESQTFSVTMLGIIMLSSFVMIIEGEDFGTALDADWNKFMKTSIENLDFFFLLMFAAEIGLKWMDNFRDFWKDYWNGFDCAVTVLLFVPPLLDILFPNKEDEDFERFVTTMRYFRVARIVRTLNAVTRIQKIWVIWEAITRTFTALVFITVLMAIFFYIFAIIGIQNFGKYTNTHISQNTLIYSHRFSHIGYSLLTLFQIFTLDHWFPIMDELISVEGPIGPIVYTLTWLMLGAIIFNNFFAGVMVNYFQNISEELQETVDTMSSTARLGIALNEFAEDESTRAQNDPYPSTNWEHIVLQNIDVLNIAQNISLSPILWSRDTLFHYYIILEALSSNLYERDQLLYILNQALISGYEP
ncbi:unnamed protein product [Allacma fusca]|uniref:Ion transport domain-containing protein n=1 Tax=Allacma fusca TaxID=39272 RepID=A0A8J2JNB9_9HEXA|nr:unnamed protein product [Allacma fusca]